MNNFRQSFGPNVTLLWEELEVRRLPAALGEGVSRLSLKRAHFTSASQFHSAGLEELTRYLFCYWILQRAVSSGYGTETIYAAI